MVNNREHFDVAITKQFIDGFSAYFNLINNWCSVYFDEIRNINKHFISLRPFAYRQIFESTNKNKIMKIINSLGLNNLQLYELALLFSSYHPCISTTITGMSNITHAKNNINAIKYNVDFEVLSILNKQLFNLYNY